jgi:hypothetical protein
MGIKNLIGFCLFIIGIGLSCLIIPFLIDGSYFNHLFLVGVVVCAVASFFTGAFILYKTDRII